MSASIQVIMTDGRKVRAVYGSNDFSTIAGLLIDDSQFYQDELDYYFVTSNGSPTVQSLITNIVTGNTDNLYISFLKPGADEKFAQSTLGAVYSYVLRDISLHFGYEFKSNKEGFPILTSYMSVFETRSRSYFPILYSLDFPHIFVVLFEELDQYYNQYLEKLTNQQGDMTEAITDLKAIFAEAQKSQLDIFLINF